MYKQNEFVYENAKILTGLENITKTQNDIIKLLLEQPYLTQVELARMLGVGERKIRYNMKELIDNNYIKRVGSSKTGKWIVIKREK